MIIAVASGKGGTGKTTVTAALAANWSTPVAAVDLDVEEPNLHLFLHPAITGTEKGYIEVPKADESMCNSCGACAELCQFKAIALIGDTLLTFPDMCHGCGGCIAVCPTGALTQDSRELGELCHGTSGDISFHMGRLRIGEAMCPPLMKLVKNEVFSSHAEGSRDIILDSPPGASCPAVCAVQDADCVVLVTEPTPFGFYDFKIAYEAFSVFNKPMGVVVNKAGIGNAEVYDFCKEHNIPIWAEIPFDKKIAEAYSTGSVITDAVPSLKPAFAELTRSIQESVHA
ncbi:MAG: ATP-binding protein [Desulfovibrionales bacterium]|nr:ATP-binding protein [Desulfovibrionales bacterium]